ncbi:creatininase family protein [Xinfangfangia sp. CPCC 101601]|uniref:Creatininase family protein n=1 Tax=Pseudogemmobacter lacusdianii TaxID=3069608 RepID=A0ABU0VWB0_9RHOB|nr:creatininase family protein [Xinfangfangia sp. CPCC 101601]MDQ2066046.1 creatininase family protein [Xinfangfangia sp. CPCC 101601]
MRLDMMAWEEVEAYLATRRDAILPVGSTEQHGPIGLIGTDALCATAVAERLAERTGSIVLPPLAYTPAPFNMGFPGTISVSEQTFSTLLSEIFTALSQHGFQRLYVVNGHGANLAPLRAMAEKTALAVQIRSWWDYPQTNALRARLYGAWEGMHATPSEIALTQALHRRIDRAPLDAPELLDAAFRAAHSGDRHGPPDEHRARFPCGRVGSWSELARPEHGQELLALVLDEAEAEFKAFAGLG